MLCFRKHLVAKKCKDKKRGVKSQFCVENFFPHSTEIFRRGTSLCCVSENIWWRKSLWRRTGGGTSHFSVEKFFFTVPKNFVAEHISLSFTLGIE